MKHWKLILFILLCVAGLSYGGLWFMHRENNAGPAFRTAAVGKTDIVVNIAATGTIEPEQVIDIGAQVTGQITAFGKDTNGKPIDYGSKLVANQLIANIDDTLYQADLASAQASVESAKAGVARATADLAQMQAKLYQAQRDWTRAQSLGPSDALSQVDYDTYQSNFEVAKANTGVGDAALAQAKTTVTTAEASLKRAEQNIKYCTIVAPVNGTVIQRRVNVGQTVVSNLSASSLFLIAKDLKQMQLWVPVNEADIGAVKSGQPVSFTCDTYPGDVFHGTVNKVRLNAASTQNVITYTVEVTIDNSSGRLLPYMSANVQFETDRRDHVLSVPNSVLRWQPRDDQQSLETKSLLAEASSNSPMDGSGDDSTQQPEATSKPAGDAAGGTGQHRRAGGGSGGGRGTHGARSQAYVWIPDGDLVKPIRVRLGISDGVNTEVVSGDVSEGQELVMGDTRADSADASGSTDAKNPFMPQFPRGGNRGGRPR